MMRRQMILTLSIAALLLPVPAFPAELLPEGVTEDSIPRAPAVVALAAQPIAYVELRMMRNTPEATELISTSFRRIWSLAASEGLMVAGSPMEIMDRYEEADGTWRLWAAIPLERLPADEPKAVVDIQFTELKAGAAVQAGHRGDHANLGKTHSAITAFLAAQALSAKGKIVEQHFDDPHKTPPEDLRSAVTYFLE